jgi:3-oxoacyl-[acyl-carrier protein] reductase
MDLGLRGKKAIVTGGSRGIGRAIAETLAAEGADVGICARDAAQVAEAVAALKAKGVQATGGVVDIANGPALKAWIADAGKTLGGIDILVPNASGFGSANTEQGWDAGYQIDILGTVRAVEAARPFLERAAAARGDAAIVIIASVSAAEAPLASPYGAVKAALIHFAKGLARQDAAKHIRANVVSPGTVYFKGGVWHRVEVNDPQRFDATMKRNPTGRMATPQEVANAAVFLASPVSAFTTGINLVVDGAITVRVNY